MTRDTETVRLQLERRRRDLLEQLDTLTEPPAEGASVSFGKRIGDGTTEAVERLTTTAAARSLTATLADIDRALGRIAEGTYGFCEVCGEEIPEARLEALPASTRCVRCASV